MSVQHTKYAPANISLHIERVVLDGGTYTSAQLGQLQTSMEQELTILLRAGGLPAHDRTEMSIRAQAPARQPQTPSQLGRTLAQSVYDSLHPTPANL